MSNKTVISLEELYKEYSRALDAAASNELSGIHLQGALAYLEIKAKDSNIIFIAPELNHGSKDYRLMDGVPKDLYDDLDSSSELYIDESSEYIPSSEETENKIEEPTQETEEANKDTSEG
jgi:hypothetical protein